MVPKNEAHAKVREGWHNLVRSLIARLDQLNPDYEITKVKSHNGGLRFYADGLSDNQISVVREAERRSLSMCEHCGRQGRLSVVNNGAGPKVTTTCTAHYYSAMESIR